MAAQSEPNQHVIDPFDANPEMLDFPGRQPEESFERTFRLFVPTLEFFRWHQL